MRIKILLVITLVSCGVALHAGGGNGGPMGMVYLVDLSALSDLSGSNGYGIPAFDNQLMMWGGSGTNWVTNALGVGLSGQGGFQFKLQDPGGNYAALYTACGIITFESMIMEIKMLQLIFKFGPGFMTNHFVLQENSLRHEFAINSGIIYGGLGLNIRLSDSFRLEIGAGLFTVTPAKWELMKLKDGTEDPYSYRPADTDFSGMNAFVALKFGQISSGNREINIGSGY